MESELQMSGVVQDLLVFEITTDSDSEAEVATESDNIQASGLSEKNLLDLPIDTTIPSDSSSKKKEEKKRAKKQKKEKKEKNETPSTEDPSSTSSSTNTKGNWEQLALIWPVDERPEGLMQDREWVEGQSLSTLITFMDRYCDRQQKRAKQEETTSTNPTAAYMADQQIEPVKFDVGKTPSVDDCFTQLHPARFLRMPCVPADKFWGGIPTARAQMYKRIDLKPVGANSQVADYAIGILHDRANLIELKFFHRQNAVVSLKQQARKNSVVCETSADYLSLLNWQEVSSMRFVPEAVINYGLCLQMLWPYDMTGYSLLKLYTAYDWLKQFDDEKTRVRLISTHFHRVSMANRDRAAQKASPISYTKMEKLLKELLGAEKTPNASAITAIKGESAKKATRSQSVQPPPNRKQKVAPTRGKSPMNRPKPVRQPMAAGGMTNARMQPPFPMGHAGPRPRHPMQPNDAMMAGSSGPIPRHHLSTPAAPRADYTQMTVQFRHGNGPVRRQDGYHYQQQQLGQGHDGDAAGYGYGGYPPYNYN